VNSTFRRPHFSGAQRRRDKPANSAPPRPFAPRSHPRARAAPAALSRGAVTYSVAAREHPNLSALRLAARRTRVCARLVSATDCHPSANARSAFGWRAKCGGKRAPPSPFGQTSRHSGKPPAARRVTFNFAVSITFIGPVRRRDKPANSPPRRPNSPASHPLAAPNDGAPMRIAATRRK